MSVSSFNDPCFEACAEAIGLGASYIKRRNTLSFHASIEAGRTSVPLSKELLFSAIQKYIRRGLYHKAVWCVHEVSLFTNILDPGNMAAYLRKYPDRK